MFLHCSTVTTSHIRSPTDGTGQTPFTNAQVFACISKRVHSMFVTTLRRWPRARQSHRLPCAAGQVHIERGLCQHALSRLGPPVRRAVHLLLDEALLRHLHPPRLLPLPAQAEPASDGLAQLLESPLHYCQAGLACRSLPSAVFRPRAALGNARRAAQQGLPLRCAADHRCGPG